MIYCLFFENNLEISEDNSQMGLVAREPVFVVFNKRSFKPVSLATMTS